MGKNYAARCQACNRIVCIASETLAETHPKDLAKDIGQWIRWGLSIERVSPEEWAVEDFGHTDDCPKNSRRKKPSKQKPQPLFPKECEAMDR